MIKRSGYSSEAMKDSLYQVIWCYMLIYGLLLNGLPGRAASLESGQKFKSYSVNRVINYFPEKLDLSTPELAYATISRVIMAQGEEGKWRRVSVKKYDSPSSGFPPSDAPRREVSKEEAEKWLNTKILEVRIFRDRYAGVIALLPLTERLFDLRWFEKEEGEWRNTGNDQGRSDWKTIEDVRKFFDIGIERGLEREIKLSNYENAVALKPTDVAPFVRYLKEHSEEPEAFVMEKLSSRVIVLLGEIHHRQQAWNFNCRLVERPDFHEKVGIIFMELSSHCQPKIDSFLASKILDTKPVIETLRETLSFGWAGQGTLDFFKTVWRVNQKLPADKKIRVILADIPRPYSKMKTREDLGKFSGLNRDQFMADCISTTLCKYKNDNRNSLFLVGMGHVCLGPNSTSAGSRLRDEWGPEAVYTIFTHTARISDRGEVFGRLRHGIFDSAFAEMGNKPIAFELKDSPFGSEIFDAMPEVIEGTYQDNFDAYLFLGPLKEDYRCPLIEGFYDEEFFRQLDRRNRISNGKSLAEDGINNLEVLVERILEYGYGKPTWRDQDLGPINAWQMTDEEVEKWLREHSKNKKSP